MRRMVRWTARHRNIGKPYADVPVSMKTIRRQSPHGSGREDDLGVYSGDRMVDATLYNIRRERRCEFIAEGMRWDDLKRWRSWDRLFTEPYIVEGINFWMKPINFTQP